jgi:predicted RNase H-like nuclease (RuvC/YqgF family)
MGPASAIAAAGVGGYMFGKNVVNPALNTVAEYLTGTEGETVGTSLYGAVDSIAGSKIGNMLGFRSDEQKSKEAEEKALIAFGQSKISKGEKISAEIAKVMVKNGIPVLADQIASKTDATKLGERESLVEAVETTADSITNNTEKKTNKNKVK